jgi:hypothetical protein
MGKSIPSLSCNICLPSTTSSVAQSSSGMFLRKVIRQVSNKLTQGRMSFFVQAHLFFGCGINRAMDEARNRVLAIVAGILVARQL